MSTLATDELLGEIQDLIREREREGVVGLAERIRPAEWAALVPQLNSGEIAVLLQWLPDDEVPQLLEELDPAEAAAILRSLSQAEARDAPCRRWTPTTPPTWSTSSPSPRPRRS